MFWLKFYGAVALTLWALSAMFPPTAQQIEVDRAHFLAVSASVNAACGDDYDAPGYDSCVSNYWESRKP